MALTREIELKLDSAGLIAYFNNNTVAWQAAAQDAYDYAKKAIGNAPVRPDDVAKPLRSVVEIHPGLKTILDRERLSQKYWIDHFTSLVIDRAWPNLRK